MSKKSERKTLRRGDIINYSSVILVINSYTGNNTYLCEIICNSSEGCDVSLATYGIKHNNRKPLYRNNYWTMNHEEINLLERRNTPATYQHILDNYDKYISMPALPFNLK